jgi:hypothetical protein
MFQPEPGSEAEQLRLNRRGGEAKWKEQKS